MKEKLESFQSDTIRIFQTITRANTVPAGYKTGRVTPALLKELGFPEPSPETIILWCGPDAFNETLKAMLTEAGYTDQMTH